MKQIIRIVSLACTMALVKSDCSVASPCDVPPASRSSCGPPGISKFYCQGLGCCYAETTGACYQKVSICDNRNPDLTVSCPGSRTRISGSGPCALPPGETCGIGLMPEYWECDDSAGAPSRLTTQRCCCDTPCNGTNTCGIPPADRTTCMEGSANINTQAECFAAHCCFEDGATITCFEPNTPPEVTCDMVYPGCKTP